MKHRDEIFAQTWVETLVNGNLAAQASGIILRFFSVYIYFKRMRLPYPIWWIRY